MTVPVASFQNKEFCHEIIEALNDENPIRLRELLSLWIDEHGQLRDIYSREQFAVDKFMENNIFAFWEDHGYPPYDSKIITNLLRASQLSMDRLFQLVEFSPLKCVEPVLLFLKNTPLIFDKDLGARYIFLRKLIVHEDAKELIKHLALNAMDEPCDTDQGKIKRIFLLDVFALYLTHPEATSNIFSNADKKRLDLELVEVISTLPRPRHTFDQALLAHHLGFVQTASKIMDDLGRNLTGLQPLIAAQSIGYDFSEQKIFSMLDYQNRQVKLCAFNCIMLTMNLKHLWIGRFNVIQDSAELLGHISETLKNANIAGVKYDNATVAQNIELYMAYVDGVNQGARFRVDSNHSVTRSLIAKLPESIRNKSEVLKRLSLEEDLGL